MFHCFYNNQIKNTSETLIPVNDLGLFRGYGLFDFFRTYNGIPFQWDWYWARFCNSAEKLGLVIPFTESQVKEAVAEMIDLCPEQECSFRFVLTGGVTLDGMTSTNPSFFILSEKISEVADLTYAKGIKVETREYIRDMPEIKSTDYKFLLQIMPDLKKNKSTDVLFVKEGWISELSRSNIFVVSEDKILTPKKNILKGITRKTVIEQLTSDFEVQERDLTIEEVLNAKEVFTTSSTKKVLSISQIDDHIIGDGQAGPVSQLLLDRFNSLVQNWKG